MSATHRESSSVVYRCKSWGCLLGNLVRTAGQYTASPTFRHHFQMPYPSLVSRGLFNKALLSRDSLSGPCRPRVRLKWPIPVNWSPVRSPAAYDESPSMCDVVHSKKRNVLPICGKWR